MKRSIDVSTEPHLIWRLLLVACFVLAVLLAFLALTILNPATAHAVAEILLVLVKAFSPRR